MAAGEETVRREAALRERQTAAAAALARRRHALERVPQLQETSRVQEQVFWVVIKQYKLVRGKLE